MSRDRKKDLQVLEAYYAGDREKESLSDHQLEKLDRIEAIYRMLLDWKSQLSIVKKIVKLFKVSRTQAYREIQETQFIFGNNKRANKEFKRHMAEQMALKAFKVAKEDKDAKAMASATRAYIEASGCNLSDPDLPDFEKLQPNVYPIILDAKTEALLSQLIATPGAINLSKIQNIEDVEFEEIPKGDDPTGDPKAPPKE